MEINIYECPKCKNESIAMKTHGEWYWAYETLECTICDYETYDDDLIEKYKYQLRLDKVLSEMWTDHDYQHIEIHKSKETDTGDDPMIRLHIKHHYGKLYLWTTVNTGSGYYETELEINLRQAEDLLANKK